MLGEGCRDIHFVTILKSISDLRVSEFQSVEHITGSCISTLLTFSYLLLVVKSNNVLLCNFSVATFF